MGAGTSHNQGIYIHSTSLNQIGWLNPTCIAHDPTHFLEGFVRVINLEHVNTPQTQAECNCTSPCISRSSLNKASRQNVEKKQGKQTSQGNNNHSLMETSVGNNAKLVFKRVVGKKRFPKRTRSLPAWVWMFPCFPGMGNRAHDGFS